MKAKAKPMPMTKAFKPCKGCPTPAKCAKMGACAMKMKGKY
jgi:hypothetical protein